MEAGCLFYECLSIIFLGGAVMACDLKLPICINVFCLFLFPTCYAWMRIHYKFYLFSSTLVVPIVTFTLELILQGFILNYEIGILHVIFTWFHYSIMPGTCHDSFRRAGYSDINCCTLKDGLVMEVSCGVV